MTAAELERYVEAAAAALGLSITPEQRPGVLRYFALAAAMADRVGAEPLNVHDEPAEVFLPVSPPVRP